MKAKGVFAADNVFVGLPVFAQAPVKAVAGPERLIKSSDPKLEAKNKRVADMLREFLGTHHFLTADQYSTADHIQHHPNADSGRDAAVTFFALHCEPLPAHFKSQSKNFFDLAHGQSPGWQADALFRREAACDYVVQRPCMVGIIPGKPNAVPGSV